MSKPEYKSLLLLHFNILIFSLTGIFSKCAANSVNQNGIFDIRTMIFGAFMILTVSPVKALFFLIFIILRIAGLRRIFTKSSKTKLSPTKNMIR